MFFQAGCIEHEPTMAPQPNHFHTDAQITGDLRIIATISSGQDDPGAK
jgi:hypothetical protein